jgi:hypothetical protein
MIKQVPSSTHVRLSVPNEPFLLHLQTPVARGCLRRRQSKEQKAKNNKREAFVNHVACVFIILMHSSNFSCKHNNASDEQTPGAGFSTANEEFIHIFRWKTRF